MVSGLNAIMGAIHLIYKRNRKPTDAHIVPCPGGGEHEWISGNWVIAEATAKAFIGQNLYFHPTQIEPSTFGGVILGVERIPSGEFAGRVVFRFKFDESFRKVRTDKTGWSQEKKITW